MKPSTRVLFRPAGALSGHPLVLETVFSRPSEKACGFCGEPDWGPTGEGDRARCDFCTQTGWALLETARRALVSAPSRLTRAQWARTKREAYMALLRFSRKAKSDGLTPSVSRRFDDVRNFEATEERPA